LALLQHPLSLSHLQLVLLFQRLLAFAFASAAGFGFSAASAFLWHLRLVRLATFVGFQLWHHKFIFGGSVARFGIRSKFEAGSFNPLALASAIGLKALQQLQLAFSFGIRNGVETAQQRRQLSL
jgi:hypothetical protein